MVNLKIIKLKRVLIQFFKIQWAMTMSIDRESEKINREVMEEVQIVSFV